LYKQASELRDSKTEHRGKSGAYAGNDDAPDEGSKLSPYGSGSSDEQSSLLA